MSEKIWNILIPEDIPSVNKGEAAILVGIVESLKPLGKFELNLFSVDPDADEKNYECYAKIVNASSVVPRHIAYIYSGVLKKINSYLKFWFKHLIFYLLWKVLGNRVVKVMKGNLWQTYVACDLVIMCHDNIFAPLYHSVLAVLFKSMKKPVVLYGASVSPANHSNPIIRRFYQRLTRMTFMRASVISLREELTYHYLRNIGVNPYPMPMKVTADLAFLVRPASEDRIHKLFLIENLDPSGQYIGMTLGSYLCDYTLPNLSDDSERLSRTFEVFVGLVDFLTQDLGADVVFIPHCIGPGEKLDDRVFANKLRAAVRAKEKVRVITSEYTPEELKGLASRFEFCLGSRLHSIVDATSMLIPSFILTHSSDFRCQGIIGDMLGQREWVYNVEDLDLESLVARVNSAWLRRKDTKADLKARMVHVMEHARENGKMVLAFLESRSET